VERAIEAAIEACLITCEGLPDRLTYRSRALALPKGVRLVRFEPKAPPVRLSPYETITNPEKFITSTLRQVDAYLRGAHWLAGSWDLATLFARLEMCGLTVECEASADENANPIAKLRREP
jgi:hypothetical protein